MVELKLKAQITNLHLKTTNLIVMQLSTENGSITDVTEHTIPIGMLNGFNIADNVEITVKLVEPEQAAEKTQA